MVVTVRRRRQSLGGRNREFEERDGATGFPAGDQEAHSQRAQADGFIGGVAVDAGRFCHVEPRGWVKRVY